jgi:hypothetical protein
MLRIYYYLFVTEFIMWVLDISLTKICDVRYYENVYALFMTWDALARAAVHRDC